jgi:hypothetical protein
MANQNPIQLDKPPVETDFIIPKKYADTEISLSIGVELNENEWKYTPVHHIYLAGNNLYPEKTPDPTDLILNNGSALESKFLVVISNISRIKPGGNGGTAPKVMYTLLIKAGDIEIGRFQKESTTANPSDFSSLIKFIIQP